MTLRGSQQGLWRGRLRDFSSCSGAAAHFHCLGAITVELNWVNESMAGRREEPQFRLFLQDARPGPAQGVPSCLWSSAPRVPGRKPSTPSPQLQAQDEFPEGNGAAMPGGVHQLASAPHPGLGLEASRGASPPGSSTPPHTDPQHSRTWSGLSHTLLASSALLLSVSEPCLPFFSLPIRIQISTLSLVLMEAGSMGRTGRHREGCKLVGDTQLVNGSDKIESQGF